jgi:hypothetical protein
MLTELDLSVEPLDPRNPRDLDLITKAQTRTAAEQHRTRAFLLAWTLLLTLWTAALLGLSERRSGVPVSYHGRP